MIQEKQNIDGMKELCFEQELKVLVALMKTVWKRETGTAGSRRDREEAG